MKFTPMEIPDVILIEPKVFQDDRGFFYESYSEEAFSKNGIITKFMQDNHSRSKAGVLRGLHFQVEPMAQAKLVRVIRGEVFDVAVDMRSDSSTFGKYVSTRLSEENKLMVYIPPGFAHGFCVLKDDTEFQYKVSNLYSPRHERGIIWNDMDIGIKWPDIGKKYILSQKDSTYPSLEAYMIGEENFEAED